jgi:aspartyl/asparaginyl beta-hydroxylase (cupin superfamily)
MIFKSVSFPIRVYKENVKILQTRFRESARRCRENRKMLWPIPGIKPATYLLTDTQR